MCHLTLDDLSRKPEDLLTSSEWDCPDAMRSQDGFVPHPNEVLIDGIGIEMTLSSASWLREDELSIPVDPSERFQKFLQGVCQWNDMLLTALHTLSGNDPKVLVVVQF